MIELLLLVIVSSSWLFSKFLISIFFLDYSEFLLVLVSLFFNPLSKFYANNNLV